MEALDNMIETTLENGDKRSEIAFKDILKAVVFLLCLLVIMEGVNLLFSWFNTLIGGTDKANFFYTRTGKGTAVLEILWNWIGIELIYLLPLSVIAVPLFGLYYSPYFIYDMIKKRK